ncbi:MAG: glucuronate isomerase, partial [Rectinemataceae bacterium]
GMLEAESALPRTILYTLDPTKHSALATLAGSFCGTRIFPAGEAALQKAAASGGSSIFQREAVQWGIPGKVQLGAAWWFNDQKEGMERHMREYASVGLLGAWVGMLTDSRSFLSFPRHEYFRRILCDIVGGWIESGELPDDPAYAQSLVRGICWENAVSYFGMISGT